MLSNFHVSVHLIVFIIHVYVSDKIAAIRVLAHRGCIRFRRIKGILDDIHIISVRYIQS